MAEAGNELSELNLEPKRRWFTSTLAQLMVFLNGIILTFTAYIALNIFTTEMIKDEYLKLVDDTTTIIHKNVSNLGSSVTTVSTILSLSDESDIAGLHSRVSHTVPNIEQFERVFWLRKASEDKFNVYDFYRGDSERVISNGSMQSIYDYVYEHRPLHHDTVKILSDLPNVPYVQEQQMPIIKGRTFAFVVRAKSDDKKDGVVVGITRLSNAMDRAWFDKRTSVAKITIRDPITKRALYFMDRQANGLNGLSSLKKYFSNFKIGSSDLNIEISAGKTTNLLFMEKLPWFILVFGLTLTVIGTFYVRNNQRQSLKLAGVNKELAHKNYELSNEMAERERLYQVMRKAERENRAIIDSVSDIIFETNTDGKIIFLNGTWKVVTGFNIDQAIGRNLFDMLHPQDQDEQKNSFSLLVSGKKQAYRAFTRLKTSSGEYHTVELAVSMIRQDENKDMRVVGTITDVEERRRAERALSEAEKKYRTIVENAAGGIYQVTPDGHILSANPAMARILGYSSSEQLMREIKNIHSDIYADPRQRSRFIQRLENEGASINFEALVSKRDGKQIWVNENARTVKDDDGNILYFEGSIEEITQRKEAEIKLREAKMHSDLASRAKSEFLANMSHELRTPLNAIIGFSEIIKDEILGPVGQKQYWEYSNDIYESGKSLLQVINEILDVSKIDAGDRHLNEGIIDIGVISKSCIDMMSSKAEAGQLSIVNMMQDCDVRIIGEELAIKQVLLNLLSNAIKFTPAGGRITLSHEVDNDRRLRVSVTDTGVGLSEEEISKALTPFGQIETSHSRSTSGAGLGLTLVDSLIKLHGGELELFSQKGIGTTATIIIPAKRVAKMGSDPEEIEGEGSTEYFNIHPASPEIQ